MSNLSLIPAFLKELWSLTVEMAPYLLLGFFVAGLLRAFVTEAWVRRHLGKGGFFQILKAVVIGIPLPLCSCGVIPVAAGIRRQGGRPGAVAAFTAATPQTGVDAIAASVGMLGWPFTIVRVVIAFFNGILCGLIVDRLATHRSPQASPTSEPTGAPDCGCPTHAHSPESPETSACCSDSGPTACCSDAAGTACCSGEEESPGSCCGSGEAPVSGRRPAAFDLAGGLRFGFVTLPRDLFSALLIGLMLAAAISTLVPQAFFEAIPGGRIGAYALMTGVSLPLYVCSTGSIPMAFSFLAAGLSPGAVLLFLIAGPATNTATVSALWSMIGGRATVGYVGSIIATAWMAAYALDVSGISLLVMDHLPHHHADPGMLPQIMAGALVSLLLVGRFAPLSKAP